jgi:hypothetical protein
VVQYRRSASEGRVMQRTRVLLACTLLLVAAGIVGGLVVLAVASEEDVTPPVAVELKRATVELHQAQTAIAACMAGASRATLDSGVIAWDGSPGQVVCTVDSTVYDAAQFLQDTFKATYDVDLDGQIYNGTPISWSGIAWDDVNLGWVEAE